MKMIDLEHISIDDIIVLDIEPDLSYKVGQEIVCHYDAMNFFNGVVNSYEDIRGVLSVKIQFIYGIAKASNWSVNIKNRSNKYIDRYYCRLNEFINLNSLKCGDKEEYTFIDNLAYTSGQIIIISYNIDNYVTAHINTYDKNTGKINITILSVNGTVSRISWFVGQQL
jgi:hypothetical protein